MAAGWSPWVPLMILGLAVGAGLCDVGPAPPALDPDPEVESATGLEVEVHDFRPGQTSPRAVKPGSGGALEVLAAAAESGIPTVTIAPAQPQPGGAFNIGDDFKLALDISAPAYVYVLDFGTNGEVNEIYPLVKGGRQVDWGRLTVSGTDDSQWKVDCPVGKQAVMAIASNAPVTIPRRLMEKGASDEATRRAAIQKFVTELTADCRAKRQSLSVATRDIEIRGNCPEDPSSR